MIGESMTKDTCKTTLPKFKDCIFNTKAFTHWMHDK